MIQADPRAVGSYKSIAPAQSLNICGVDHAAKTIEDRGEYAKLNLFTAVLSRDRLQYSQHHERHQTHLVYGSVNKLPHICF